MDGLAFAKQVKNVTAPPAIILLSSVVRFSTSQLSGANIAATIAKPVKESTLREVLGSLFLDATGQKSAARDPALRRHMESGVVNRVLRVLVAEDNPVNQKVALRMLEKLGCRADIVANGKEAVDALLHLPYDMVFMDCNMPEMDGFTATQRIRENETGGGHTVIVAMTANALEGDREKCLSVGMDDYISKPVDQKTLAAIIQRWSDGAPQQLQTVLPRKESTRGTMLNKERFAELEGLADPGDHAWIQGVVAKFLDDAEGRIGRMRAALELRDAHGLRDLAHALKGSAGNIGAESMAEICRELQATAEMAETEKAVPLVSELAVIFDELKKLLRDRFQTTEHAA